MRHVSLFEIIIVIIIISNGMKLVLRWDISHDEWKNAVEVKTFSLLLLLFI